MWVVIGFGALGLLVGNLVGLSSGSIVGELVSLLFVFVGGSVLAFLHKLTDKDRQIAGGALLSLSLACIVGMYAGILASEYRWLSPPGRKTVTGKLGYERGASVSRATVIDATKDKNGLTQAYREMYQLALEYEDRLRSDH